MEMKIKVTYDKDFYHHKDEWEPADTLEKDRLIGFFDSVSEAEKAVEELFKKEDEVYYLTEFCEDGFEEADVLKIFETKELDGKYYVIYINYNLVLKH